MRIVVDTNVVMDILIKREPFFQASYDAIRHAVEQGFECLVSASAITDIFYLLRREMKDAAQVRQSLERLLTLFDVADVLGMDIQTALSSDMNDFEDAVIHAVAMRYGADAILTRNARDFRNASMDVCCPAVFLARCEQ